MGREVSPLELAEFMWMARIISIDLFQGLLTG